MAIFYLKDNGVNIEKMSYLASWNAYMFFIATVIHVTSKDLFRKNYQSSFIDVPNCILQVELGDLMVSLSYLPSAERLTVGIIKARNLRVVDDTRCSSGML
jgi:hypothetical protein